MIPTCHCGRRGLYNGACHAHAPGMAHARSRKGTKKRLRAVSLCRNGLHPMVPTNRRLDLRGGCLACQRITHTRRRQHEGVQRSARGRQSLNRPVMRPTTAEYQGAMAEAVAAYRRWEVSPERRTFHWTKQQEGYYV